MARTMPKARVAKRTADFTKGPVRTLFDAAVEGYENLRGLNVGGAESGRRAKSSAMKKARKYGKQG